MAPKAGQRTPIEGLVGDLLPSGRIVIAERGDMHQRGLVTLRSTQLVSREDGGMEGHLAVQAVVDYHY